MEIYGKCKSPYIDKEGIAHGCGQCLNCKKAKTLEWIIRCKHETITQKKGIYITLTYSPKNLKRTAIEKMNGYDMRGTLDPEDITKFLKKLRQLDKTKKLRYIYCGEYGERHWRPHYHMIIWGIGIKEISRETLENIWGLGYVDKSEESINDNCVTYIVSYLSKKKPSKIMDTRNYTNNNRLKPYIRKSQGIGKEWCDKNMDNWSRTGTIPHKGQQYPIPRYYIKRLYESEGRKIKYNVQRVEGKTNNYKIIKNPNGEKTLRIWEIQHGKIEENRENWEKKYKLGKDENEKVKKIYKDTYEKRIAQAINDHKYYGNKTDKEISEELSYFKRKDFNKTKTNNESPINDKTLKRLKEIVKKKEVTTLRGLFGKRNKMEMNENIYNQNKYGENEIGGVSTPPNPQPKTAPERQAEEERGGEN